MSPPATASDLARALRATGLPPASCGYVAYIIELLQDGYNGKIEMTCNQGGVRQFTESRYIAPTEVKLGEWSLT
jgi:hypothetical protein